MRRLHEESFTLLQHTSRPQSGGWRPWRSPGNEAATDHAKVDGSSGEHTAATPADRGRLFPPTLTDARTGKLFSGGNGLFSDMLSERALSLKEVERQMIALVKQHCPEDVNETTKDLRVPCPIAGMSVQCDRELLKDEMPAFYG